MSNDTLDHDRSQLQECARTSIDELQRAFDRYQRAWFVERPPEFFCLELCGEAGELANLEKKRWRGTTVDHAAVSDEAADVLIALMNFANARGIDLAAAVAGKLQRIAPTRHDIP